MRTQRWLAAVSVVTIAVPFARIAVAQVPTAPAGLAATVRPATLADNIEEFAGQNIRMPNARIVEILEPNAFLIEAATRYRKIKGQRDRILVLINAATLRASAEPMLRSTVTIVGTARTLLGVRTSAEVPWPIQLDRDRIKSFEVRGAVLAASVQAAEGTELTQR